MLSASPIRLAYMAQVGSSTHSSPTWSRGGRRPELLSESDVESMCWANGAIAQLGHSVSGRRYCLTQHLGLCIQDWVLNGNPSIPAHRETPARWLATCASRFPDSSGTHDDPDIGTAENDQSQRVDTRESLEYQKDGGGSKRVRDGARDCSAHDT